MSFDTHTKTTPCKCDMCGRPLQAADDICSACESVMEAEASQVVLALPYTCPACKQHVPEFETFSYPEGAPWYRPTTYRNRCPRCKAPVRRKYETRRSRWISLALWISWYVLVFEIPFDWSRTLGMGAMVGLVWQRVAQELKAGRDPDKYVRDERN